MDVLRDHRQNDLRHDLGDHRVRCNAKTDERCDHRLRVGDHHRMGFRDAGDQNLDESHVNRNCVRHDRKMGAMTDVSHDHRRSDRLDDLSSYVTKSYRVDLTIDPLCYVTDDRNDLMTDVNLDVSLCLRMSDRLDDHSMDDDLMTDVNRVNRNCVRRDLKTDASRVNRNCVRRDLKMDVNLDGKNLHVK